MRSIGPVEKRFEILQQLSGLIYSVPSHRQLLARGALMRIGYAIVPEMVQEHKNKSMEVN